MFKHLAAATFTAIASVALSSFLVAATSPARAAEITLQGPASFRVLFPKLLPEFEKSSGHKVTAAYAPLGVITERVINGEAIDVAIVSGKQNEDLEKQGKLLAGSRAEIAQVGFTVFVKKGAAKPDLRSADALKRALLAAKSIAVGDPARGGGASLYTIDLLKRLGISEEVKAKSSAGTVRHRDCGGGGERRDRVWYWRGERFEPRGRHRVRWAAGRSPELFSLCGGDQREQQASRRRQGADRVPDVARGQASLDG